ncbi:MAG: TolC family protein [Gemmobacter sp.]
MGRSGIFIFAGFGLLLLQGCDEGLRFPTGPGPEDAIAAAARGEAPEGAAVAPVKVDLAGGFDASLRAAVRQSPSYAAAQRRAEEARLGIAAATSAERPQISAGGTLGAVIEAPGDRNATTTGAGLDLSLSQLIYDGGETAAGIGAAQARAIGAVSEVSIEANARALEAGSAWIDLWRARTQQEEIAARLADIGPLVAQLDRLTSAGMIDRSALLGVERAVIGLELEREQLMAQQRDAEARFRRHFGAVPATLARPPGPPAIAALARQEAALGDAPRLMAGAAAIVALDRQLEAAQARLKPKVGLRTGLRSPISASDDPDLTAGIYLQHVFGDGGRRQAEIETLTARAAAARADLEDARATGRAAFEAALSSYRALIAAQAALARQIELLGAERTTLRSQLASGQANLSQLIDVEVNHYRAVTQSIANEAQMISTALRIEAETGALAKRLRIAAE